MVVLRKLFLLCVAVTLAASAQAGLAGWLTSSSRSWDFVQKSGGIRIGEPMEKDGKLVLPIEYDAAGESGVTRRPTQVNSGLVVRKVESSRTSNGQIVIQVVTQLAEQNSDSGRMHYADLDDFAAGAYTVYYEDAGDPKKLLGRIRVR